MLVFVLTLRPKTLIDYKHISNNYTKSQFNRASFKPYKSAKKKAPPSGAFLVINTDYAVSIVMNLRFFGPLTSNFTTPSALAKSV